MHAHGLAWHGMAWHGMDRNLSFKNDAQNFPALCLKRTCSTILQLPRTEFVDGVIVVYAF